MKEKDVLNLIFVLVFFIFCVSIGGIVLLEKTLSLVSKILVCIICGISFGIAVNLFVCKKL